MTEEESDSRTRILVIDDNESIHSDFAKILGNREQRKPFELEAVLFDEVVSRDTLKQSFEIDSAYQGREGFEKVCQSIEREQPFAVAFVDMRMPPGWDGLETIQHLWEVDPDLQVVICTAYSDYSWEEQMMKLGKTDRFLILKKPFDNTEVLQLAVSLAEKRRLSRKAKLRMEELEGMVHDRTEQIREYANSLEVNNHELGRTKNELASLNTTLEQKVQERTAEVEYLLAHKDQFIGQLGHDLKSPLVPLVTLLPMMIKRAEDEKQKEFLHIVLINVKFMQELVIKTLRLARLDSSISTVVLENESLSAQLNKIVERRATTAMEQDVKIEMSMGEDIIVQVDSLAIQEVLDNLIGNALKFTSAGGAIRLDASSNGTFVTVSVTDTGIGMDSEQLSHIFEEFYKVDKSRHDLQSHGLGLAICKRIIEQHGGNIWAASPGQGKGSTFYFTLSLTTGHALQ